MRILLADGRSGRSLTLLFIAACVAAMMVRPAAAVEMTDVYTAEVAWDEARRDGRELAYAAALGEVLRRITPDSSRAEAATLFERPADFVLGWREGAAGRLWVSFDGVAIGAVLRDAGVPVWGSDRPLTLVWLAVEGGDGERRILQRGDGRQQAPSVSDVRPPLAGPEPVEGTEPRYDFGSELMQAATARGIPLLLPLYDERDKASVTDSDVWGGFDEVLLAASRRYGVDSVLIGRASETQPQRVRWTWLFAGDTTSFSGPVSVAVDRVSQALIGQFASSPDASVDVRVSVIGVGGMLGYARVLRYLRGQSLIEDVRVLGMRSDQLLLEIDALVSRARISQMLDGDVLARVDAPVTGPIFGPLPGVPPVAPVTSQPGMQTPLADPPPATVGSGATGPQLAGASLSGVGATRLERQPDFNDADLYFRLRPPATER